MKKLTDYLTRSRVEAFSDGVFAIIITLLILEIQIPKLSSPNSISELGSSLLNLAPKIISWIISFMIVAVIWVNHHRVLESLKHINHAVFWLNANLLLWTSFIPFPTALMGDYPNNKLAVSFFGCAGVLMGIAFLLFNIYMWRYPEVTKDFTKDELLVGVKVVSIFLVGLYLIGAAVAWIHPYLAFACYLFIPIYFIFPSSTARRNHQQDESAD